MKTEIRKVTVEQEVYIAEDGTVFTDENKCGEYELKLLEKTFECYNNKYEPASVESGIYVKLLTKDAVKNFIQVCKYYGIVDDGINKPGIYMYSDYNDDWVNLDEVMSRLKKKENKL